MIVFKKFLFRVLEKNREFGALANSVHIRSIHIIHMYEMTAML